MYRSFYHLSAKPFQISTDPSFLWLGQKHKEAIATLKYGVLESKGLILLTGDVGTGKTTLVHALINLLPKDVIVATLPDPGLSREEFFHLVSRNFRLSKTVSCKENFSDTIEAFLRQITREHKTALLVIDEAQIMTSSLLEEVRLLLNLGVDHMRGLNVLLVGQNELQTILSRPEARPLESRVTISYHLNPLSIEETTAYINHRLRVAGTTEEIFTPEAVRRVHTFSQGFPRHINILCDLSLLFGFEEGQHKIDEQIVKASEDRVRIPAKPQPPQHIPAVIRDKTAVDPVALQQATAVARWQKSLYRITVVMALIASGYLFFNDQARERMVSHWQPIKQAVYSKLFEAPYQHQSQPEPAQSPAISPTKPEAVVKTDAVTNKGTRQDKVLPQTSPPRSRTIAEEVTRTTSNVVEPTATPPPRKPPVHVTVQKAKRDLASPQPAEEVTLGDRKETLHLNRAEPASIVDDVTSVGQDLNDQPLAFGNQEPKPVQSGSPTQSASSGNGHAIPSAAERVLAVSDGAPAALPVNLGPSEGTSPQLLQQEQESAALTPTVSEPSTETKDAELQLPSPENAVPTITADTADRIKDELIVQEPPDPTAIIDWLINESQKTTP